MENWKKAEKIVQRIVRGNLTPGSGNKGIKGDIQSKDRLWKIEVKQTDKPKIAIQRGWFDSLEKFAFKQEVALAVFVGLQGKVYWHAGFELRPLDHDWSVKSYTLDELPEVLYGKNSKWELISLSELGERVNG